MVRIKMVMTLGRWKIQIEPQEGSIIEHGILVRIINHILIYTLILKFINWESLCSRTKGLV